MIPRTGISLALIFYDKRQQTLSPAFPIHNPDTICAIVYNPSSRSDDGIINL